MNGSTLEIDRGYLETISAWLSRTLKRARAASASDLFHKVVETYATQVLRVGLGLGMTVMVARILGPQGRGLYAVALAIGALWVQFGHLGLGSASSYDVAKDRNRLAVLVGNALLVSFLVGGISSLATWAVFSLYPKLAPVHGRILDLALLVIPFSLAYLLLQNLLLGVLDVRCYNKIELANKLLAVVLVVLFWMFKFVTVEAMLLGFVLAQITTFVWLLRRLGTLLAPIRPAVSVTLLREQVGVAARAYLVMLFSFLVLRVDLLMVQYMLGPERAGQYSVAASMADYVSMLPVVVATILFPKFSSMRDRDERLQLVKKASFCIGFVTLPVVVLSALLSKPLVPLLFGRAYFPAAQAFVWLMPGIFFLGIECVAVQFLNSMGYPRSVVITWLVCVCVNISLNFWAIPVYGIVGASLNSSITYILASVLIFWIISKTGRAAAVAV